MSEREKPRREATLNQLTLGGGGAEVTARRRAEAGPALPQAYTNRYEIKYLVAARDLAKVRHAFEGLLEGDANNGDNGGYFNHSIYFDSPHYRYYTEKHEGQLARVKPRLRFYRATAYAPPSAIYLELKGRYDRIVAKRRTRLDMATAEALLRGNDPAAAMAHNGDAVAKEFTYLAHRFNLQPCVTVLYHREAFFSALYKSLRVTFDSGLLCSLATEPLNPLESYQQGLPNGETVLEVKYNDQIPKILLTRLNTLGLQQRTFSKFAVSLERCFDQFRSRRFRASRFA
ncbi:VTC domain-containing protein [Pelagibius sp.]|uniref:VTC domain-containing protein n=1 Tax=Pelagibius sp. TaxID=1931238 RepID=UPI003BB07687